MRGTRPSHQEENVFGDAMTRATNKMQSAKSLSGIQSAFTQALQKIEKYEANYGNTGYLELLRPIYISNVIFYHDLSAQHAIEKRTEIKHLRAALKFMEKEGVANHPDQGRMECRLKTLGNGQK